MSGGVDSSVAAALLVRAGYEVVGVTLRLWGGESDSGCCSVSDVDDARRVAQQLDIAHHVFNFAEEFDRQVVDPYVEAHLAGKVPNPCIECNRHLKFDHLLRRARLLGFDRLATGHHARVVTRPDGRRRIARGADAAKDQSYVLYMVGAEVLAGLMLPVGSLDKDDVRALAAELGLRTAAKPDSQDVCFIRSDEGRRGFLSARAELHPGVLVDAAGDEVGSVPAVELVTPGQRRGLGLAGGGTHRYAVEVDVPARRVRVGTAEELLVAHTDVADCVWTDGTPPAASLPVLVQASAHGPVHPAEVLVGVVAADEAATGVGDASPSAVVRWREPQRRVAPGQSVVFYDPAAPAEVLGGAVVAR
ncbi:MAG: tRNA 2-thiouridine(34) synthase MnmA [Acidimicrobiia bacterium]|nr:tRNA 2-thiouridine(34) synthase MnmA [Acidimicrobiia bacterium]